MSDLDKSLETLFYMKQLAEEGRLKPKQKRNMRKADEDLEKKQGVPKGVDPAKHERCVMDVKASGKDKSSAFAICNSSMNKGGPGSGRKGHTTNHEERNKIAADAIKDSKAGEMYPLDTFMTDALDEEGGLDYMLTNEEEFKQKMVDKYAKNVGTVQPEYVKEALTYSLADVKAKLNLNKVLPLAGKTIFRTIQNLVKPASGGDGSEADKPVGGYDGASVAHGSGGAKKEKGPGKKMSKSLFDRILEKGGIGSGRKGHHTFTQDGYEHDSVFEDSQFDNMGEREAFKDKMVAAAKREEEKAYQRIRESEGKRDVTSNISRKGPKAPAKKNLLQRIGQKIIDAI